MTQPVARPPRRERRGERRRAADALHRTNRGSPRARAREARRRVWRRRGQHPRLPPDAREQIHHAQLMLEDEERDDVAVRRQVVAGREAPLQCRQRPGRPLGKLLRAAVGNREVSEVRRGSGGACHVPAAPPLLHRRSMIRRGVPEPRHRRAVGRGRDAPDEESRNAERRHRVVTAEASLFAQELRRRHEALRQHVEHRALPGIVRRDLDEPAAHPRHHDRIVEVDRARVVRLDPRALQARRRKDDDLRLDRHVERPEQ